MSSIISQIEMRLLHKEPIAIKIIPTTKASIALLRKKLMVSIEGLPPNRTPRRSTENNHQGARCARATNRPLCSSIATQIIATFIKIKTLPVETQSVAASYNRRRNRRTRTPRSRPFSRHLAKVNLPQLKREWPSRGQQTNSSS